MSHTTPHQRSVQGSSAALSADPSGTSSLRFRRFRPAIQRRWIAVRAAIRKTIVENDALGITRHGDASVASAAALAEDDAQPAPQWAFARSRTNAEKIAAFDDYLRSTAEAAVLEPTDDRGVMAGRHYSSPFVREAHMKALRDATQEVATAATGSGSSAATEVTLSSAAVEAAREQAGEASILYRAGDYSDTLATSRLRTYRAIEKQTNDVTGRLSEVATRRLPEATNKADLADALTGVIGRRRDGSDTGLAMRRSTQVAVTETLTAYTNAKLDVYRRAGVELVGVSEGAEYDVETAGDRRVCSDCRDLAHGGPYSLDDIRQYLPQHPRCRCIPVIRGVAL